MAGTSLLALIDDIATLLDDVAVMSKVAVKKTAGVLGDDLALNAQQVTGVTANRELPVVWAVAKGSLLNKAILVPAALAISAFVPVAITPLLMVGGLFLCYEGFEKLAHKFMKDEEEGEKHHAELVTAVADPVVDMVAFEQGKIKGAIRTDFILSAEIIVISLGAVASAAFGTQVAVLVTVAVGMTVGVYGLVAAIVKLDDLGVYLGRRSGDSWMAKFQRTLGAGILAVAPRFMKFLSIAGMAAMFIVGGGILAHGIAPLHKWSQGVEVAAAAIPSVGFLAGGLTGILINGLTGIIAGAGTLAVVIGVKRLWKK